MKLALNSDRKKNPTLREYREMTAQEIRALTYGDHPLVILRNGRVGTVKVNGAVKTWVTRPDEFEIPVKYGMYECARLSASEAVGRFVVEVE